MDFTAHEDDEGGREDGQQQGGSRSILVGLDPEFDSGCSKECEQLAARIARLEVVVRRARASMDFTAHEDDEGGREDGQQQGGSRSIQGGLDPEFDPDC